MAVFAAALVGSAATISPASAQSFSYTDAGVDDLTTAGSFMISRGPRAYTLAALNGTVGDVAYNVSNVAIGYEEPDRSFLGGPENGVGNS